MTANPKTILRIAPSERRVERVASAFWAGALEKDKPIWNLT
jgi:hypothetical protein